MGAVAVLERDTMADPVSAVDAVAAKGAVVGIPGAIMELGGSAELGDALAEAMRLVLLNDLDGARRTLTGKYPEFAVEQIMDQLTRGLRPAA